MDQPRAASGAAFALWNLGFRPFYLLASVFAALGILAWIGQTSGAASLDSCLAGPAWHAHEMVFGFTLAVVAGFLLTAVRAWTGLPTPAGLPLAALAGLWVLGRVLVLTSCGPATALVTAAFPIAVAWAIGVPLVRSANRRNYFFIGLLVAMGAADLTLQLSIQGSVTIPPAISLRAGLDIVLFLMVVMGGRVIPMFTNNGVPGAGATRQPLIETLAPVGVLALLASDLLQLPDPAIAAIALACALVHAWRLALWRPWRTLGVPLVWILHLAYAWIVIHLLLRAAAAMDLVSPVFATHALTTGAIGGLTLGMMTRTTLGHTARALKAGTLETTCFVLVQLAALVRVFGGIAAPGANMQTVVLAGILWSSAFGLYAIGYWPILSRPRLDGKPG
jgi:uncharacterized protein involved in response to NO